MTKKNPIEIGCADSQVSEQIWTVIKQATVLCTSIKLDYQHLLKLKITLTLSQNRAEPENLMEIHAIDCNANIKKYCISLVIRWSLFLL